ncbi:MAG TPA: hypothetical protein VF269_08305 [Rhodanobacteraceae bacterium]
MTGSNSERFFTQPSATPSPNTTFQHGRKTTRFSRSVPISAVRALVDALRAPIARLATPAILGLAPASIEKIIDREWTGSAGNHAPRSVQAEARSLRAAWQHPGPLAQLLTRGFDGSHTDDHPHVSVTASFSDGSTLRAYSTSQHYLLLPWIMPSGQHSFAADLPRAVAALLPATATNHDQLTAPNAGNDIDELIGNGLADPSSRLQVEAKAGAAYRTFQKHFIIVDIYYLHPWMSRKKPALGATLRLVDSPANLGLVAQWPIRAGHLLNAQARIAAITRVLREVQQSPALMRRMRQHAQDTFTIHHRSGMIWFNARAREQFVTQMHAMGKLLKLNPHSPLLRDAVLVSEGQAPLQWVVLPDHRAVMWKAFTRTKPIPGTMRCAGILPAISDLNPQFAPMTDLCFGKVYAADGKPTFAHSP